MSDQPGPGPEAERAPRVDLWQRARSTCTACGSEGLLEEGYLGDTGGGGHTRWIGTAHSGGMFGGVSFGAPKFLVRAFRCRECRHLELFAEDPE